VIHQVPPDFIVLSGDDAITMPLIALGGRGIVSVVSNEIPAEMTQLAQLCLAWAISPPRAQMQRKLSAADGNQLRRVESHSGESRHGPDGPARTGLPLPMVPPSRASPRSKRCWKSVGLLGRVPVAG
jgi:4-hydroxy-tetrahydrodipicolinate synthase